MRYPNNYSHLQKWLHRLTLSSIAVRALAFDIENMLMRKKVVSLDSHIFIAGMARAGSTALLNAIHSAESFASLTYSDMPFVMAPNLWSKINYGDEKTEEIERAHGDNVLVSTDSPEAFEEVFWTTFPDCSSANRDRFRHFVTHVLTKYKKNRYLSKSNQNYRRLSLIKKIFPNSTILVPFRSPASQAHSLLNQHIRFLRSSEIDPFVGEYMSLIGHCEFGPNYSAAVPDIGAHNDPLEINHWLEQWILTYQNLATEVYKLENAHFICYEKLCEDKGCWRDIQKICQIDKNASFDLRSRDYDISELDPYLLRQTQELYKTLRKLSV